MAYTLYWMQCGGCGGDTMSLLNAESPDFAALIASLDIDLLWHPSMSNGSYRTHSELVEQMLSGKQRLDILCVEGSVIRGPSGTGMFETMEGKPKKDLLAAMAARACYVVAVGTCASYGGVSIGGDAALCQRGAGRPVALPAQGTLSRSKGWDYPQAVRRADLRGFHAISLNLQHWASMALAA